MTDQDEHTSLVRTNRQGKPCTLIDTTGTIPAIELEKLMQSLIENEVFGLKLISDSSGMIKTEQAQMHHIQIRGELFRVLINRYEASIEKF